MCAVLRCRSGSRVTQPSPGGAGQHLPCEGCFLGTAAPGSLSECGMGRDAASLLLMIGKWYSNGGEAGIK